MHWLISITPSDHGTICTFRDGYGILREISLPHEGVASCTCLHTGNACIHIRWAKQITIPDTPIDQQPQKHQASKRQGDRIDKLEHAMQELQFWIEDQLSRGLATQIQENNDFAQGIAIRMADASLIGLSRRLRVLSVETAHALRQNKPLPHGWVELLLILRAGAKLQQLPDALFDSLTQFLGISIKKSEVKVMSTPFRDVFTVMAVDHQRVDTQLIQRSIWLYAHHREQVVVLIEYEVERISPLPSPPALGFSFETEAWLYPGAGHMRIHLEQIPETACPTPQINPMPGLASALAAFQTQLTSLPWLTEYPVVIADLWIRFVEGNWVVIDREQMSFPLLNEQESSLPPDQLLGITASGSCVVFSLISAHGLIVLSVL